MIIDDRIVMKNTMILFTEKSEQPVYVQTLVEEFGADYLHQEKMRSLVWELITHKDLILKNDLTLQVNTMR